MPERRSWAEIEFGGADLGDARRRKRLINLAEQRAAAPNASISQACGSSAATKAAYRFYENASICPDAILFSHQKATQERMSQESVVLAVQDTTQLDYTHHPATTGLGVLNDEKHQGLLVHTTFAVTPGRVPLGIIEQQVWTRPASKLGKKHQRKQRSISEKESQKWLTSLEATARLQEQLKETRVVSVGDREADVFDLFMRAESLPQDFLIRASWNRCVDHPQRYLWNYMAAQPVAGTLTITVPRKEKQPARKAHLTVRYALVTIRPPRHRTSEGLPSISVWGVLALEENPPSGVKAVSWLLLTTVSVECFDDACERVQWYTCRWVIEMYHKALKSGCRVEERQFDDAERIRRYLALDDVVAWRVLYLTMLGRQLPDMPCIAVLEAHEWQALYCFIHQTCTPPAEPPTLREAISWIGQLGGFLGRKGDGQPGITVVWRGMQRLHDLAAAWLLFHPC